MDTASGSSALAGRQLERRARHGLEQLALEVGHGLAVGLRRLAAVGAADRDERPLGRAREAVDRPRHHLLAGAALADEQHAAPARRHLPHQVAHGPHRRRRGEEPVVLVFLQRVELDEAERHALELARVGERRLEVGRPHRPRDDVERAETESLGPRVGTRPGRPRATTGSARLRAPARRAPRAGRRRRRPGPRPGPRPAGRRARARGRPPTRPPTRSRPSASSRRTSALRMGWSRVRRKSVDKALTCLTASVTVLVKFPFGRRALGLDRQELPAGAVGQAPVGRPSPFWSKAAVTTAPFA